jgi:hypothetical protein
MGDWIPILMMDVLIGNWTGSEFRVLTTRSDNFFFIRVCDGKVGGAATWLSNGRDVSPVQVSNRDKRQR